MALVPATEKQVSFLKSLMDERVIEDEHVHWLEAQIESGDLSKFLASEEIGVLLKAPKKAAEKPKANKEAHPGYYTDGKNFFEVVLSKQGNKYAKVLEVTGGEPGHCRGHYDNLDGSYFECGVPFPTTEQQKNLAEVETSDYPVRDFGCTEPTKVKASWVYRPGVMKAFQNWEPVSAEQAAEFGKQWGACFVCGRTLTNPESVEAGIGPYCSAKFGA